MAAKELSIEKDVSMDKQLKFKETMNSIKLSKLHNYLLRKLIGIQHVLCNFLILF